MYKTKEQLIEIILDLQSQLEFRSMMQSMVIHDQRSPASGIKFGTQMMLEKIDGIIRSTKKALRFKASHTQDLSQSKVTEDAVFGAIDQISNTIKESENSSRSSSNHS